jgi:ABC-2 type transport system permease protein
LKLSRAVALAKKDWKRMYREPAFLFLIILFPVMLTVAFGTSFGAIGGSQSTTYNLAVVSPAGGSGSGPSQQFAQALVATGVIKVQYFSTNQTAQSALSQGRIQGVLLIPASFDTSVVSFRSYPNESHDWINCTVSLYLDKGSLLSAQVIPSVAQQTLDAVVLGVNPRATTVPVTISSPSLVKVQATSAFSILAPGLFAFASIYMIMMVAQSYTGERENGLLTRIAATPATSADLISGSVLSYLVIALVQAVLVFLCVYALGYHPSTGLPGLAVGFLIVTVFATCNIGFGLITAAIAKSAGAATGISFVFLMPQLFLGTFVGASLSPAAQSAGRFVPAYYVTDALTSLFTRGASVMSQAVLTDLAVVSTSSVVILLVGIEVFKRFGNR